MKLNYFLIPSVVILVAGSGSLITQSGLTWYHSLQLPDIAPDGGLIGIVWTIIFILSAISTLLVWNQKPSNPNFKWIVKLFITNAILNVGWSYLFFGLHRIGWPIAEMVILNLTTIILIVLLWKRTLWSAILLIPYVVWVVFATYLAYLIWLLNK